jgi:6-phosphogluconolactonase
VARPEEALTPRVETFSASGFPSSIAGLITSELPGSGTVVITGGTTAAKIYGHLDPSKWDGLDVFFSDERCVPHNDDASNFKMAAELFLGASTARVHRMEGELDPDIGAARYHDAIAPFVADGIDLLLLGMGADCHVGALYPYSPALEVADYCAAVKRPDGLGGLTLTPQAMLGAKAIRVLVTGTAKAEAVVRVLKGDEEIEKCPARLLAQHTDVVFWLDEGAASLL